MKEELRKLMKEKRRNFCGEEREIADKLIAEKFFSVFGGFKSFFVYNSFSSECGTENIIQKLLNEGKEVFLPRVEGENMVAVKYGKTVKGAFGIEEPIGLSFTGSIAVTVIPLLAVNTRGYRIGYGGGFYDRKLKNSDTVKVGLGYAFQMREFEEDAWDEPLDYFICEKGVYKF